MRLHNAHVRTLLLFAIGSSWCCGTIQTNHNRLNSRIGPPVPEKYSTIRDGKDWLNPHLAVCSHGLVLKAVSVRRESLIAIPELRAALIDLPVEAWPYGRIIAVQECSIGPIEPGRREHLAAVEALLNALGVEISRWPA